MKRQAISILAALLFVATISFAADPQPSPPDEKAFQEYMSKMKVHMKTMQERMMMHQNPNAASDAKKP